MRQLDGRISLKLGGKIHRELFDEQSDQDVTYFQSHQVKSTGNRKKRIDDRQRSSESTINNRKRPSLVE